MESPTATTTAPMPSMGSCCASGWLDTSALPTGRVLSVGGVPTYLATPSSSPPSDHRALVIATDIFGFDNVNARLIADKYAALGWSVYVPDLMSGDSLPVDYEPVLTKEDGLGFLERVGVGVRFAASIPSLVAWMSRHGDSVTLPIIRTVLEGLRDERGVTSVGVIGYCWGGRLAVLAGCGTSALGPNVHAVAPVHASGRGFHSDLPGLSVPACFVFGADDHVSPSEGAVRAALATASPAVLAACEFKTYAGCAHGFACRGNLAVPVVADARENAIAVTAAFFVKYLLRSE